MVARAVAEDLPDGDPTGAAVGPTAGERIHCRPATRHRRRAGRRPTGPGRGEQPGWGPAERVPSSTWLTATGWPQTVLGELNGPADTLLAAERTLLNILTHLSGIATMTAAHGRRGGRHRRGGKGHAQDPARPAGGREVRRSLRRGPEPSHEPFDALLVKDNHIAALGGVKAAVEAARHEAARPSTGPAAGGRGRHPRRAGRGACRRRQAGPRRQHVPRRHRRGGAPRRRPWGRGRGLRRPQPRQRQGRGRTGVHYLAVGALTHSSPALDIGLDWALEPGLGAAGDALRRQLAAATRTTTTSPVPTGSPASTRTS